ncbi:MAG: hypothetical protein K2I72_02155, partial [Bacilli bacterium]|nr:hypothetical protein [Bacilli bacterium]
SNRYLKDIGKDYNKDTFAMAIYELYRDIIDGVQNERYEFLRDVLSDEIYNSYLRGIKLSRDHQVKNIVADMKPTFSRLVSLIIKGDMEVAKVWIRVSFLEYALDMTPLTEEQKQVVKGERIVGGSKTRRLEKEYILTLVKAHTPKESVACPSCGHVTHVVLRNQCTRCGSNIANRRFHWVMIGKEEKPLSHIVK